jgi:glyoxylase-like metal-dependent hydrolase (beta-lactamase superfamily II)
MSAMRTSLVGEVAYSPARFAIKIERETAMKRFTRLFIAGLVSALTLLSVAAYAAAPMVKTQAPGYYRFMLGDFEVTAISDGTINLPMTKLLMNITAKQTETKLAEWFLKEPFETSVNAYLINTGAKLVLVDTGAGVLFGPTLGRFMNNFKASGYQPEQVDEIYITHMHGDHVGGLMNKDQMAFPNAVVRAHQLEADQWLSQAKMDAAPAEAKGFFQGAMATVGVYAKAGKFQPFSAATELVAGVRAKPAVGHTPGHTFYVVESKGQKLVLWGDLMHAAAVQFGNPAVTIQFDSDRKAAAAVRKAAYTEAAKEGYLVGVTHLSFPGVGRLRAVGKGYQWLPLNYTNLP